MTLNQWPFTSTRELATDIQEIKEVSCWLFVGTIFLAVAEIFGDPGPKKLVSDVSVFDMRPAFSVNFQYSTHHIRR